MSKSNNGLWALCVFMGAVAFAVLFVVPRYIEGEEAAVPVAESAAETGEAIPAGQDEIAAASPRPDSSDDTGAEMAPADGTPAAEAQPDIPAFDVLRVEPDGSTVIAGRAEPGSRLDVMNGDEIVASTEVGPAGDFAAVFDHPLEPGDYQLSLRVTDDDAGVVMSEETATISIPRDDTGELLAMVTRPGKASRIVAQPETPIEERMAEAPLADMPSDIGSDPGMDQASGRAPERETAQENTDVAAASDERDGAAPSPEALEQVASQGAGGDAAANSRTAGASPDAIDGGDAAAREQVALAQEDDAAGGASPDAPDASSAADAPVRIDAVEVEDDQLFVTGSTAPGATVQIYVNDALVGDDVATGDGRFLVEGRMPLAVGEHSIRADVVEDGRVTSRALVPFMRPEGQSVAAVAPSEPAGGAPDAPETASAPADGVAEPAAETALAPPPADDPSAGGPPAETAAVAAAPAAPEAPDTASADDASGDAAISASEAGTDAAEPPTIEQAALEPSDSSVIIRRGDTLWQISRRVYGQGVRYTTIYLANQQQIVDPDRILPGQVFAVPEKALENAEELHRQRLRDGRDR